MARWSRNTILIIEKLIVMKKSIHHHHMHNSIKIFVSLLMTTIIITGCTEDFLERKPKGQLTFDTFFENEAHAILATNAIYEHFRSWEMSAFPWIGITDIISDDADKGSNADDAPYMREIDEFTFNASNSVFQQAWLGSYHAIFRANLAIENIPGIDMNTALRDRLVAEAKFLRAYTYFRLVQWFGGVPIIDHTLSADEYYNRPRATKEAVYDFIESDLMDAINVLPEKSEYASEDLGRATKDRKSVV